MSSVGVLPFLKNGNLAIAGVMPASQLHRPTPPMATSGVAAFDELTGGLPRGALSEICGPASSGRTTLLLAALAARTAAGEACALVDVGDSFDPASAASAGVDLGRVLWVRCGAVVSRESRKKGVVGGSLCAVREEEDAKRQARVEGGRRPSAIGIRPQKAGKKNAEKSNVEAAIEAGVLRFDPDHEHNAHHLAYGEVVSRESPVVSQEEGGVRRASSVVRPLTIDHRPSAIAGASCPLPNRKLETGNRKLSSLEQALKATDLLLQAGGFGMVVVDLGDVPGRDARRIPLASWFRFRRVVENTATVFVVLEREPFAKQCASLVVGCWSSAIGRRTGPTHARLLEGTEIEVEVVRAPGAKKAAGTAKFATLPAWAVKK